MSPAYCKSLIVDVSFATKKWVNMANICTSKTKSKAGAGQLYLESQKVSLNEPVSLQLSGVLTEKSFTKIEFVWYIVH